MPYHPKPETAPRIQPGSSKHWSSQELGVLRRLRERFLSGDTGRDYWRSEEEMALYDGTFAQRIGWKWDAVLLELQARGWQPRSRNVVDWGCGSGIASRCVLHQWPAHFARLTLVDRSRLATRFAMQRASAGWPGLEIASGDPDSLPPDTLLIVSHVLNELPEKAMQSLLHLARQASEIVWVEAGTHEDSRGLIKIRESLRGEFAVVAPCTHQRKCGMLAPENATHWCHSFAKPPPEIFQDARWHHFSRELGIDLRSVPFSFLVLTREATQATAESGARMIGRPRDFKGHSKVLSCEPQAVVERTLQKRDDPGLLRELRDDPTPPVYQWSLSSDGHILAASPVG